MSRASQATTRSIPRAAIRAGIDEGRVSRACNIDEKGNVTDVHHRHRPIRRGVFDRAVHRRAVKEWKFTADGEKYVGEVEINFTLKD